MSTWISRVGGLGAGLLLTGCVALGGSGTSTTTVTDDAIQLTGPRGFCVDTDATTDRGSSAFVLLGNCAALAESRMARQPEERAVLTAAISEPGEIGGIAASLSTLPEFFASEDGRRVLSRSGESDSVDVIQSFVEGPVFYLNARDNSPGALPGVRDDYWRAYLDLGTRITTLSVLALDGSGMDDADALNLLSRFVALTRDGNPALTGGPDAADVPPPAPGLFQSGLFQRILGPGR